MKLTLTDANYCATVVAVPKLIPLENCDNLTSFSMFGCTAIVSKDTQPGTVGILFTAETQLDSAYCHFNNLYRDSTLNKDPTIKGYIENNRRVRAMKFRGNKSSALFMPLTSLNYLSLNSQPNVGDTFNEIDGASICIKYEVYRPQRNASNHTSGKTKKFVRIDNKTFPEHFDTENYRRNKDNISETTLITVTQKLHGSSGRFGFVKTKRQVNRIQSIIYKRLNIVPYTYDYVAGSRKVIKDKHNLSTSYYDSDIWNHTLDKIKHTLPKDYIFYGEIIGYTPSGSPIQKDYTYNLPTNESELYIYRITIVNEDGVSIDLHRDQLTQLCDQLGLKHVPLLRKGYHIDFNVDDWIDKTFYPTHTNAVPLASSSPCDEGVCIRKEGLTPYVLKAKSPLFLNYETEQLDTGVLDLETEQSLDVNK